ncbi:hypothetical protein GIB67_024797, partial [Kingdonia uniflora]
MCSGESSNMKCQLKDGKRSHSLLWLLQRMENVPFIKSSSRSFQTPLFNCTLRRLDPPRQQ